MTQKIPEKASLKSERTPYKKTVGHRDKRAPSSIQVAVRFNDEMFEEILSLSQTHNKTFAHAVRRLCAIGLQHEGKKK